MVYSPSMYLVASAVTAVVVQMQQATATSLLSDPIAILPPTELLISVVAGMRVDDNICRFEAHSDQSQLDLATIPRTDVLHPDLLSNQSTPSNAVYLKVGINVVLSDFTINRDEYTYAASKSVSNLVTSATKTDAKTPSQTGKENVKDEDTAKNCVTDWNEPTTTLNSGDAHNKTIHAERRLEEHDAKQIVQLEDYFGKKFETTLATLPTIGVVSRTPWPGPYWPTFQDSINVPLYQDTDPTSAKYAFAFGLNVKSFMDTISKESGIDKFLQNKKECEMIEECSDNSHCSIRPGENTGFCIPTWWGICNGWASAAILESEPECSVTHNGVTFYPLELKGLLSYIHASANLPYVFTGVRFNGDDSEDVKDEYGRSKNLAFFDMNPGLVHIVIANIMGKFDKSFIMDVTAGLEVWNQPVRGFKVMEQTKMSLKKAAATFYGLEMYPWNVNAKSIVYMKTRLTWIVESNEDGPMVSTGKVDQYTGGTDLTYLLEINDNGTIIGGEWLHDSLNDHPDFMWFPKRKPTTDLVLPNGMSYANVSMLLKKSVACSDIQ